jgi:hypothetical protein
MYQTKKYYTDENTVRLTAFFVIVVVFVSLFFELPYLLLLLVFDFIIRASGLLFSPLALFSKSILKISGLKPKPIFTAPKRFTAILGSIFTLTIVILMLIGFYNVALGFGLILILLAALESFFKICVGCYIFQVIVVPIQNKLK